MSGFKPIGTVGGSGGGVTEDQGVALSKITYDEATDSLTFDASLSTKPSSVYLGKPFKLSNGVQAVSYALADGTEAIGLINRFGDAGSRSNPRFFALAPVINLDVNLVFTQTLTGDITVPFTTLGDNLTSDFMFRPATAGRLLFEIWLGTDETGAKIFDEYREVTQAEVDAVAPISFGVGNKYLLNKDTAIYVKFSGIDLFGSATQPYFVSKIHPFKQIQINGHTESVTDSTTLFIGCEYEVDNSDNASGLTLTVPLLFTDTFYVNDATDTFSVSRPCNVDFSAFGVGVGVLQTAGDRFKFWHDGTKWMRRNLNTNEAEAV